jgi:hypothetical protein
MNTLAKHYGVQHLLPCSNARSIVMREPNQCRLHRIKSDKHSQPRRSSTHPVHMIMKALQNDLDPYGYECDCSVDDDNDEDDENSHSFLGEDTSFSSESSDDENDEPHRTVSFCTPLVTACYLRPTTSAEEKKTLYYTDKDYREFRRNYFCYNRLRRDRSRDANMTEVNKRSVVQFHLDDINDVYIIPTIDNPSELYYSRLELQG